MFSESIHGSVVSAQTNHAFNASGLSELITVFSGMVKTLTYLSPGHHKSFINQICIRTAKLPPRYLEEVAHTAHPKEELINTVFTDIAIHFDYGMYSLEGSLFYCAFHSLKRRAASVTGGRNSNWAEQFGMLYRRLKVLGSDPAQAEQATILPETVNWLPSSLERMKHLLCLS